MSKFPPKNIASPVDGLGILELQMIVHSVGKEIIPSYPLIHLYLVSSFYHWSLVDCFHPKLSHVVSISPTPLLCLAVCDESSPSNPELH